MMRKNLIDLVQFLVEKDTRTVGKDIAVHFDLTLRTIQNYIREINIIEEDLIDSNTNGYQVIEINRAYELLNNYEQKIRLPENNEERGLYIIKQILISKRKFLKIYEVMDQLHISLSTFNNTLTSARLFLEEYSLEIDRVDNVLRISGSEQSKRRLLSDIIYDESSHNMLLSEDISQHFGTDILHTSERILDYLANEEGYSINDYVYQNILLHLCILLFRVREGNKTKLYREKNRHDSDRKMLDNIIHIIQSTLQLTLDVSDQTELLLLVKTKINIKVAIEDEHILNLINPESIKIVEEIITEIDRVYNINLGTDSFRIPFSLHIQNLLFRMKNDDYLKNASATTIRESYPLIYDISVHTALMLQEKTGFLMIDDEISFVALHIGAELERQKENKNKIKTVFIVQEYLDIQKRLVTEIQNVFESELDIITIENQLESIKQWQGIDLVISTKPYDKHHPLLKNVHYVHIPSMNVKDARYMIFEVINDIEEQQKLSILTQHFDFFFKPSLFIVNQDFDNREDVIRYLGHELFKQDYVSETFTQHVLEREALVSTAFGPVAVPHQFVEPSKKSGVFVLIDPKGIQWESNLVNIVLLVSITSDDKRLFKNLYEALLCFFTVEDYVRVLSQVSNFYEFKEELFKRIDHICNN